MSALDSLPEFLCYDNKSCRYEDLIEDLQAQLRAAASERDELKRTIAQQAAIIKEQEQDIAYIKAREAAVVENHRRWISQMS